MKKKSFPNKLFMLFLALSLIIPGFQFSTASAQNAEAEIIGDSIVEKATENLQNQTPIDPAELSYEAAPTVANTTYNFNEDLQIQALKARTYQIQGTTAGRASLYRSPRDLTKEEIDQLVLAGAGKEDLYWVNLLFKKTAVSPEEIFKLKRNGKGNWEEVEQQLLTMDEKLTVENAVYTAELKTSTVTNAIYTEENLTPTALKQDFSTFDLMVASALDSLVVQQQINQTNKPQFAGRQGSDEKIDPVSGALTWKRSDINLPGRDGLDLNIGVMYNSNQAFAYMRDYYSNSQIKKYNYLLSCYDLGMGWSFQFPSVQNTNGYLFYHDGQGGVYRVDFYSNDTLDSYTHLVGYQGKDVRFMTDSGSFTYGNLTSAYYLEYDSKKREYFTGDGRLIGIEDRYGNTNKFDYTTRTSYNGEPINVISAITDSLERVVKFDYETTLQTTGDFSGEKIIVSVTVDGVEKKVTYNKYRSNLTFNGTPDGYAPVLGYIINQNNEYTYFTDTVLTGKFNFYYKTIDSNAGYNGYQLISRIQYPNSYSSYDYKLVTRNLGSNGVGEEVVVTSRKDYTEFTASSNYNQISYSYNGDYTGYPNYWDVSYLPSDYQFSSTSTVQSASATNGLATTYTFNHLHQPVSTVVVASNGERKETRNTVFHPVFKFLPTRTTIAQFANGDTDSTANMLYTETNYTDWGAFQSTTLPMTASQFENVALKSKYTTSYSYEPSYHELSAKSWYQNDLTPLSESYSYNEYGRILSYTDPKNETTTYTYEAIPGEAKKISKIEQKKSFSNGMTSKVTTILGSEYKYAFPTEQNSEFTNIAASGQRTASSVKKTLKYEMVSGRVLEEKDGSGRATIYAYDKLGRITSITYPQVTNLKGEKYDMQDLYTYTNTYSSSSIFDSYNKGILMLLVNSKRKYTQKSTGAITYFNNKNEYYDGFGILRLEQVVDTGAITQYRVDDLLRTVYAVDPMNNTTNITLDAWGNQSEALDAYGNLYVSTTNLKQRKLTSYLVEAANVTTYRQNTNNASLKMSYVEQNYDQWGKLVSNVAYKNWPDQTQASIITESFSYDYSGNLTGYIDPKKNLNTDGVTTKYAYDGLNHLTSVKDALDQITSYQYDENEQITQTSIQAGASGTPVVLNSKEYNEMGQLIIKRDGNSQAENVTYNSLGLPETKTDRNGTIASYKYDERNQLTESVLKSSTGVSLQSRFIFGNDGIKSDTSELIINGATSSQKSTIDTVKRTTNIASTASGYSASTAYVYDKLNRTTRMTSTLSGVNTVYTNYQYDKLRLTQVQTDGSSTRNTAASANAVYDYYASGMIKSITYPTLSDNTILKTEYQYDALNRLKSVRNIKNSEGLSIYSYVYDNNGNIIAVTEALIGNDRQTTNYTYDNLNRLLTILRPDGGKVQYTYDLRGNRQTLTDTSTLGLSISDSSYTYNLLNMLTTVTNNNSTVSFSYLPNNLRYQKSKDSVVTKYNYNGAGQVVSETRSDGQKASYIRGDRLLVKKDYTVANSIKDYYYLYNGHGDVVQIVDTAGKIVNSYSYDVWGNISNQTEEIANSFKYAGEIYDSETGLYYLRSRYYDPSIGRFINEDTYEGQIDNPLSLNIYTYVNNNPLKYIDPSGHAPIVGDSPYDTAAPNTVIGYIVYVSKDQLTQLGFKNVTSDILKDLNTTLGTYDITTSERISHFLAQVMQESELGKWTTELGGKKYFSKYEPGTKLGKQLGNKEQGDGYKFRGAGYIQMTGRYNYQRFADAMGDSKILDLGAEYVAENYAWRAAGFWWDDNNMNKLVDSGASVTQVTRRVNGGTNHLANRQKYYALAKKVIR
ncbi:RHS repeat protein [Paenibacillus sp. LMG 31459]|uniref:RHS repeat protein n=1 Tax=Paenibacillus phytohabitans TaxID=2654978 RepID=A0ABX1YFJ9_9BACL|nr:RHS repeat-associated core domain-containing protein [Paenibacillus phytohabitans]NOU79772.1 RHS repeat protein [Paenibacillus phytohabitans]